MFGQTVFGLAVLDRALTFVRINPVWARVTGRPASEVIGRTPPDVGVEPEVTAVLRRVLVSGEPAVLPARSCVSPGLGGDGAPVWDVTIDPVRGDDGSVETLIVSLHDATHRVRAARTLGDAERAKDLILSSLSDAVLSFGAPDMRIAWANRAMAEMANRPVDMLPGLRCHEVLFGLSSSCPVCPVRTAFETGRPAEVETLKPDGRMWALRAFPMRRGDGTLAGVVEVARDITAQTETKRALARTVADLERAQRLARVGNWSLDPGTGVPVCSDELYRIQGLPPTDPVPPEFLAHLAEPDRARLQSALTAAITHGTPFDLTLGLSHAAGPPQWLHVIGEPDPRVGPAGHVVHGTIQDITGLKQAQDALRASEETLRLVIEVADDGIWDFCVATGAVTWNARFFRMLGHEPGAFETTVESWMARIHPADRARVRRAAKETLATQVVFEAEYRLRRADGSWLWIWDRARPVAWDGDGRITRIVGAATDIDARKRHELAEVEARIAAERTNEAKSRFLAAMSHELRTPLNAVLGFSEIIKDEILGPIGHETYRRYAADIHASGRHLIDLINSLMDLAKIEAGRRELALAALDVADVIAAAVQMVCQPAARGGLTLVWSVASDTPALVADGLAVRQVLFNLLANALKYTPKGGRITVSARPASDGGVAIAVADTGIGIAAADQKRLFEPFTRAVDVERRAIEGTGLGLALVKSLMEMHAGHVSLESTPGVGSVFTVWFPPQGEGGIPGPSGP
ncbi:PAS domain-containing sensor histidine kinase [Roseospira marina]|nr:PAS domain-containing protein [Roseospira marina]